MPKNIKKIARGVKRLKDIDSMDLTDAEKSAVHSAAKADAVRIYEERDRKRHGSFITNRRKK